MFIYGLKRKEKRTESGNAKRVRIRRAGGPLIKLHQLGAGHPSPIQLSRPLLSLPYPPFDPAAMDDEGEIIYSTPLPGASSIPASIPVPGPAPQPQQPLPPQPVAEKPADYVYYERRPDDLSSDARARATAAKVKLQSHYRFALETAIDLNIRCVCVLWSGTAPPSSPPRCQPVCLKRRRHRSD